MLEGAEEKRDRWRPLLCQSLRGVPHFFELEENEALGEARNLAAPIWAIDRIARLVTHFLQVLDELNHFEIDFISFRENNDTTGPLGWAGPSWSSSGQSPNSNAR